MKKTISLILASILLVSALCLPAYALPGHANAGDTLVFGGATAANAFGSLLDWTGVVLGNVNNVIDVEGTLAVGGSFLSNTGFSVNSGAYGASPASTEDVSFLVNGNVNISGYGNVWGQTVVGTAEGNVYKLSNVTPSETTNAQYTVANTAQYFADAASTAYAVRSAIAALPVNGVCEAAYGTYTFLGDPEADVLVYNVDDSVFNSYLFDFTIADGQTIIVNLTASGKIDLKYGGIRINGNMEPDYLRNYTRNIVFNVVNATEIEMTSCELDGILLAPDADLTGKGSNVCGNSILNGLTGMNGFELHVGYNNSFVPTVSVASASATGSGSTPGEPETPAGDPAVVPGGDPAVTPTGETVSIRIDVPLKMAVTFADGTVYYGGEMKDVVVCQEYPFQMCAVNWDNGVYDGTGNGICGTVVYRMIVVHRAEFNALVETALQDPDRYTVKGIDIIDNEAKTIIVNCDEADFHLETDVNNFFVAYRFHFASGDYNKKTGIQNVINTPLESLSVNLPVGSTISCNAYVGSEMIDTENVFITRNSGEGIYEDVYLTSVNDYTWAH